MKLFYSIILLVASITISFCGAYFIAHYDGWWELPLFMWVCMVAFICFIGFVAFFMDYCSSPKKRS